MLTIDKAVGLVHLNTLPRHNATACNAQADLPNYVVFHHHRLTLSSFISSCPQQRENKVLKETVEAHNNKVKRRCKTNQQNKQRKKQTNKKI